MADVASVGFRQSELRALSHLPEGLQPPQRFLDRVAVHYAKNVLAGEGRLPQHVPLILGIWGHKVCGLVIGGHKPCVMAGSADP